MGTTGFGGVHESGDASRAHLALVGGTAITAGSAEIGSVDPASRMRRAIHNGGTRMGAEVEVRRSKHEDGVRAVAAKYPNFEEALLPMVLASGVSGDAAISVAEAIKRNPALKAQAERAFARARVNAVE